ncbi:ABC transporter G family member 42-like [Malania oleifera]|uniref:ABC transporter G family member 42-like n=1 Tax=Malania oleifera TaxID=397392 RepID=UPI0025AE5E4C|nr:ABC transporter G family member 42-like [Malania oleifera]
MISSSGVHTSEIAAPPRRAEDDVEQMADVRTTGTSTMEPVEDDHRNLTKIDVRKLDANDRTQFVDRCFGVAHEGNETFLKKLRTRFDRVGVQLPTVEVRFEELAVEANCFVGSRALPTLLNTTRNVLESALGLLGLRFAKRSKLTILNNVSGIIKPSRLTLLLGPPSSGKTTLLQALAGKLDPSLKVSSWLCNFLVLNPREKPSAGVLLVSFGVFQWGIFGCFSVLLILL